MAKKWSPADIQKVMAVSSACSCLGILVGSISIGVVTGRISSDLLGSVKGIGVGGGLVGLAMVLYMVIRVALKTDAKDRGGKIRQRGGLCLLRRESQTGSEDSRGIPELRS